MCIVSAGPAALTPWAMPSASLHRKTNPPYALWNVSSAAVWSANGPKESVSEQALLPPLILIVHLPMLGLTIGQSATEAPLVRRQVSPPGQNREGASGAGSAVTARQT